MMRKKKRINIISEAQAYIDKKNQSYIYVLHSKPFKKAINPLNTSVKSKESIKEQWKVRDSLMIFTKSLCD